MDIHDITLAVGEMNLSQVEELNTIVNERRFALYKSEYEKIEVEIYDFLKKIGDKGFAFRITDGYGEYLITHPNRLSECSYNLSVYHNDDVNRKFELDVDEEED